MRIIDYNGTEAVDLGSGAILKLSADVSNCYAEIVIPNSIKEYGYVHRVQKADEPSYSKFVQDNYYYICDVENKILEQQLDDYENFEKFTLELVDPKIAININRNKEHGPKDLDMIEREAKVLELLIKEGYFN